MECSELGKLILTKGNKVGILFYNVINSTLLKRTKRIL